MKTWCANCEAVREMDVHLRCGTCASDAVDTLDRINRRLPSFIAKASRELDAVNERLLRAKGAA